jgi:hypothetical protein
MPLYRIYRLKDTARQQFRWAPHTIGVTKVKPKDYAQISEIEAVNVYAAWMSLKDSPAPLEVGDILEVEGGELRIYKYVGFEEAQWQLPEEKPPIESPPASSGSVAAPPSS